jgi:hypothetical protein
MDTVADQIEVKNVSFEYTVDSGRVLAIKDINFSVRQSEFLCYRAGLRPSDTRSSAPAIRCFMAFAATSRSGPIP